MKYQNLLFSRSLYKDYRWILTPSFFSQDDKNKLKKLLWLEEIRHNLPVGINIPFSFCLVYLSQSYVLARFLRTEYKDAHERPIDCIDGVAVHISDAWWLRLSLVWLLTEYQPILNSWACIDFKDSDLFFNKEAKEYDFDLNILSQANLGIPSNNIKTRHQILFNRSGFTKLLILLYPSPSIKKLELLQIAYGVTNSVIPFCEGFEIISELKTEFPKQDQTISQQNSTNTSDKPPLQRSSSSSYDFQERVDELKKKDSQQENQLTMVKSKRKIPLLSKLLKHLSSKKQNNSN